MEKTPKSLRLHIALSGRTNAGKSSLINMISGQDVSLTSPVPGTTTDAVEKTMELLPIGPVVLIDTAGLEDDTILGAERIKRTMKVFDRTDIAVVVCNAGIWGNAEQEIVSEASKRNIPVIAAVTKCDLKAPDEEFVSMLRQQGAAGVVTLSAADDSKREMYMAEFKKALIDVLPDDFLKPPPLLDGLLPDDAVVILVTPIDTEAPKGRLIMPQVQTIRELLNQHAAVITVQPQEYSRSLAMLKTAPDLVICDSQAVHQVMKETPAEVPCTTFSILFSRLKGDMPMLLAGTDVIKDLKDGDRILIAEACSHHAADDDIGRVKIPRLLKKFTGAELICETASGRDYPSNLKDYKLIVHCGGCMLNRREMLSRLQAAARAGVPVTNYGMCISCTQGVLDRAMSPFGRK